MSAGMTSPESTEGGAAVAFERDRGVTHLSARTGVGQISVYVDEPRDEMAWIFRALADAGLNVYLIKIHDDRLCFAVDVGDVDKTAAALEDLGLRYSLVRRCALVSVVAPAMRDLSGVMWRIVGAMREARVEILEIADAFNAVSCLVHEPAFEAAVGALSSAFGVSLTERPDPLDPW